jgi:hypothetical protein
MRLLPCCSPNCSCAGAAWLCRQADHCDARYCMQQFAGKCVTNDADPEEKDAASRITQLSKRQLQQACKWPLLDSAPRTGTALTADML